MEVIGNSSPTIKIMNSAMMYEGERGMVEGASAIPCSPPQSHSENITQVANYNT